MSRSWNPILARFAFIVLAMLPVAPAVAQQIEYQTFQVAAIGRDGSPLNAEPFGRDVVSAPEDPYSIKWLAVQNQITGDVPLVDACRDKQNCDSAAASKFAAVIAKASAYGGRVQLATINRLINLAIRRASDLVAFGEQDHWAAPIETFSIGRGDCEEFAIAKYVALSQTGWPAGDLRLVIVLDRMLSREHMVLGAREEGHWWVLDNRSNILAEDRSLTRFIPLFVLDGRGVRRVEDTSRRDARGVSSEH